MTSDSARRAGIVTTAGRFGSPFDPFGMHVVRLTPSGENPRPSAAKAHDLLVISALSQEMSLMPDSTASSLMRPTAGAAP